VSPSDATLARELAAGAGEALLALRKGQLKGRELGAAGDAAAHRVLADGLARARPDDAVLSEEAAADPGRLSRRRVWIVDPLDGTREYGEGRDEWAVHVALCVDGNPTVAAVAIPALGAVYGSQPPPGIAPRRPGPLRIAVSRSRPPDEARHLAAALGARLEPLGSAGFKAMAVLRGEADAYLHAGGQHEWDSAAPAGVALAAGLHASRIDGAPLRYNRPDPRLPDLLLCRAELAEPLLAALAETRAVRP
jgi:3'(2'), 5'-bisphosphate nucleotidase